MLPGKEMNPKYSGFKQLFFLNNNLIYICITLISYLNTQCVPVFVCKCVCVWGKMFDYFLCFPPVLIHPCPPASSHSAVALSTLSRPQHLTDVRRFSAENSRKMSNENVVGVAEPISFLLWYLKKLRNNSLNTFLCTEK